WRHGERAIWRHSAGASYALTTPGGETGSARHLAGLRGTGRTVLVNFTVAWCIPRMVNERTALGTAKVRQASD
ncbi:MAG: hypothetical protein ACK4TK_04655, partial [Thiobacillaceae bacterium]